jgi:transposase
VTVRNVFFRVFYRFHAGRKAMSYKVAGIDVHKKVLMVVVVVVVVAEVDASQPEWSLQRRRLGTTTSELRQLADWLRAQGVEEAVMESTAQYWKPVWYELEPYVRLQLAQAFSNRAPRGRKHDFPTPNAWCGDW